MEIPTSRKKILFISHSSDLNGAEISLFYLLQGLDRDKYEAFVLFPRDGQLREKVESLGWQTLIVYVPWWIAPGQRSVRYFGRVLYGLPKRLKLIRKLIRDCRIDLIYTNTVVCFDGGLAAKLEGKPHIWHIREILRHNELLKPYMPSFLMRFFIHLLSDRVLVPSFAARKGVEGMRNSKNIGIIINGVDLEKFSRVAPKEGLRKILGMNANAKLVAIIGSIVKTKGHLDFVDAASRVCRVNKNVFFVMVGDGEESFINVVKNRVKKSGLSDRIIFTGFVADMPMVMNSVELVVSASWVESFGRVICEAMAAGKPVVATRSGGPEEIIVDGETGLLVPVRSPTKLAEAILKLLSDEQAAREMGEKARRWASEHLKLEEYVRNVEREMEKVLVSAAYQSISKKKPVEVPSR